MLQEIAKVQKFVGGRSGPSAILKIEIYGRFQSFFGSWEVTLRIKDCGEATLAIGHSFFVIDFTGNLQRSLVSFFGFCKVASIFQNSTDIHQSKCCIFLVAYLSEDRECLLVCLFNVL